MRFSDPGQRSTAGLDSGERVPTLMQSILRCSRHLYCQAEIGITPAV
ncbi:hypothetical protein A2U01_0060576, partial [Trifolium medium]|nr:hypothetical protein [Trifolium medium]